MSGVYSSFGEFSVDMRVSFMADWIDQIAADPALLGPKVVRINPAGQANNLVISEIVVQFSEQVTEQSAEDPSNYLLLEAGPNEVFDGGLGDDNVIPVTASLDAARTKVTLHVDAAWSPLPLGKYQLTIDGDGSIVDLDGNPLNSTTGVNGGSDHVHSFDVVFLFPPGGDLYEIDLVAGHLLTVQTATLFDNLASSPVNGLDPELIVYEPAGS